MGIYFWYLLHNKFSLAAVHKKLWRGQIESTGKVGWLFKDGLRMLLSAIAALDHFVWLCPPLISETSGVFIFWKKRKFCQKPTFLLHTCPLHCFYVNYIHSIDSNYNNGEILLRKEFWLHNGLFWHRNPYGQTSCSTCLFLVGWTNPSVNDQSNEIYWAVLFRKNFLVRQRSH